MATPEQIASILSQLVALHPADCFKPIDAANAGLGAVLRLLYLADQPVTAGTISEKLHVSTARVAVLLKKLVAKGLVTKGRDPVDARVTVVALTPLGGTDRPGSGRPYAPAGGPAHRPDWRGPAAGLHPHRPRDQGPAHPTQAEPVAPGQV